MTIVAPQDGDPTDPAWAQEVTDAVNALNLASARVGVRLRRAASQSVNNSTLTTLSWDTEDQDTDGFWDSGSPTIVTIPPSLDGLYVVTFTGAMGNVGGARNFNDIVFTSAVSGVPPIARGFYGSGEDKSVASASPPLAAGDSFICQVFQSSGSAANFTGTLNCYRIGE